MSSITIVPTELNEFRTRTGYSDIEKYIEMEKLPIDCPGLNFKYSVKNNPDHYNNQDGLDFPNYAGMGYNNREFSDDDQSVVESYMKELLNKKAKLCIVEIGVHRNSYCESSTSVFLDNKRDTDVYIGIDIEDKSFLNDSSKNIYTIQSRSENIDFVLGRIKEFGITEIDILMIDGWHSINTVYTEWQYTRLLSKDGIVIFHDTNAHPGPFFIIQSIDTNMYDVRKYFSDIRDFGISVAIKKCSQ